MGGQQTKEHLTTMERKVFRESPDSENLAKAVCIENSNTDPANVSNVANKGSTILKEDLGIVEFEIVPIANQKDIEITNLSAGGGGVHFSLETGVSDAHAVLGNDDQLSLLDYSGSVFVRTSSGTKTIQIDQRSRG